MILQFPGQDHWEDYSVLKRGESQRREQHEREDEFHAGCEGLLVILSVCLTYVSQSNTTDNAAPE